MNKKILIIIGIIICLSIGVNAEIVLNMTFDRSDGIYNSTFAENLAGYGSSTSVDATYLTNSSCYSGGCYYFDGTDKIVLAGADWNNITEHITIIAVVKAEDPTFFNHQTIIAKRDRAPYGFLLSNTTLTFKDGEYIMTPSIWTKNTSTNSDSFGGDVPLGNILYDYVVYTITIDTETNEIKWYINGDLHDTAEMNTNELYDNGLELSIGTFINSGGADTFQFKGWIDSIYLYNETLTFDNQRQTYLDITNKNEEIFMVGDSITGSGKTWLYGTLISNDNKYYTRNVAVGGYNIQQMIDNELPYLQNDTINYKYTTVLAGTNNVVALVESNFYSEYTELIDSIINESSKPVTATIPPSNEVPRHANEVLVNNLIRRVSYDKNTCYNDIYHNVFNETWTSELFTDDIHPSYSLTAQIPIKESFENSINDCNKYFCNLNPNECYNAITDLDLSQNPYIGSHDVYIESATFENFTLNVSCSGTGSMDIDNLGVYSAGYKVYHNGVYQETSFNTTYTTSECSEWVFVPIPKERRIRLMDDGIANNVCYEFSTLGQSICLNFFQWSRLLNIVNNNIFNDMAGVGNSPACFDSEGRLYRSTTGTC